MKLIADGFEDTVLDTKFEVVCPSCDTSTTTTVQDILRDAEESDRFVERAERDYVRSQLGKVMCSGCSRELGVYFGHAEVQPARYRCMYYDTVAFDMV